MRLIKFRGKDSHSGEWFYGNLFVKDTRGRTHISTPERGSFRIDPESVGQYTGLKDGIGCEIFEGDVVMTYVVFTDEDEMTREFWRVGEVCFIAGGFHLTNCINYETSDMKVRSDIQPSSKSKFSFPAYRSQIVGNIHDNPELLKGGIM